VVVVVVKVMELWWWWPFVVVAVRCRSVHVTISSLRDLVYIKKERKKTYLGFETQRVSNPALVSCHRPLLKPMDAY